jgi:hypothetical protein
MPDLRVVESSAPASPIGRKVTDCFRAWTHRDLQDDIGGLIRADERCGFSMAADPPPFPRLHLFRRNLEQRSSLVKVVTRR